MRRYFVFLLVAGILLSTGCDIPVNKSSNDTENQSSVDDLYQLENEIDDNGDELSIKDSTGKVKGVSTNLDVKNEQEEKKLSITLYYQSGDGYIVPTTRKVLKQEGIAKAAVTGLIDGSINREELEYYGLYPVLPMGTEVKGLTIKDGKATIDFNDKLLEYDNKTAERNIISSIVYTLTEFKTIHDVKILINGIQKDKLKYGVDLSENLNRKNILVNSDRINIKQGMDKVDIYLLKNMGDQHSYTVPVSFEYSTNVDDNVPARIIEFLTIGSKDKNLFTEVPQKTKLLDSEIDGNLLTLNFNSNIKDYSGGSAREEGLMKQVLHSMKQIDGILRVKIMIEGKEDNLPEGTDLSGEIELPVEVNAYIDK